jgi:NDP-sugar pyrophosphorylase family protein
MKIIMSLLMFLVLGALFIISNENLVLRESGNFEEFKDLYSDWLSELFDNGRTITGYVVDSHWLPDTG